ncbi:MAG TPA: hypothetical protein VG034_27485 [Acidimicrobiia bacterium]|jgi:hypothetical protein|nr:hypothetical protein [Acidimicrobiia bacterium]
MSCLGGGGCTRRTSWSGAERARAALEADPEGYISHHLTPRRTTAEKRIALAREARSESAGRAGVKAATGERGTADVIVAKHRNGPSGKVRFDFLERLTGFAVTGSRRLGDPTQPADEEGAASVT